MISKRGVRILISPGPKAKEWQERNKKSRAQPANLVISKAKGLYITDVDGNVYLDFSAQNINTGHANPKVITAVKNQIDAGGFHEGIEPKIILAEKLKEIAIGKLSKGKVGFNKSGTNAAERVIMMVRAYKRKRNIFVYQGSYHGDLSASISLTMSNSTFRRRAYSMMPNVVYVPFAYCYRCPFGQKYPDCGLFCIDNIKYVLDTVSHPNDTAAFFIEPIQQHGGVTIPPPDYFGEVKKICADNDILFVDDEVATGFGRTGKMFALEHWGVDPDVIFLGKPIANGLDLGAVIGQSEVMEYNWGLKGNPISCAAAIANLEFIIKEKLVDNASIIGEYLMRRLRELQEKYDSIGDIRGKGLLIGIELVKDNRKTPATEKARRASVTALKYGLRIGVVGIHHQVLRLTPPLTITLDQANEAITIMERTFRELDF